MRIEFPVIRMALLQCGRQLRRLEAIPFLRCSLSSSTDAPKTIGEAFVVTGLHLHKKEKVLEVTFANGETRRFSAELLRVCSPSAENCSTGGNVKVLAGRRYVGIMGLELVGSYAVRITFDDLHATGLYTWDFLHDLGQHKFSRAKQYINSLREQGLSRDPRAARPRGGGRGGSVRKAGTGSDSSSSSNNNKGSSSSNKPA